MGTLAGQNPEQLTTLTYDAAGQLASEARPESTSTYQRDALGRLTVSTQTSALQERSTTYTWDGLTLAGQTDSIHGATSYLPDAFGRTTGQTATPANPNGSWLLADNLNSTLAMATPTGTISQVADWGTFGTFDAHTAGWDAAIGYTSQATNPATGTVAFYARNYDPTTATFTTTDSWEGLLDLPETLNNYAYVLGTPLTLTDTLGYWAWLDNAAKAVGNAASNVGNHLKENWRTYAAAAATLVVGAVVVAGAAACIAATAGICAGVVAGAATTLATGAAAGFATSAAAYAFTGDDGQGSYSWGGAAKTVAFGTLLGGATGGLGSLAGSMRSPITRGLSNLANRITAAHAPAAVGHVIPTLRTMLTRAPGAITRWVRGGPQAARPRSTVQLDVDGVPTRIPITPAGPSAPTTGRGGVQVPISPSGPLSSRVTSIRFMPSRPNSRYPIARPYMVFMNGNQPINPLTGRSLMKSDPLWHIQYGARRWGLW